MDGNTFFSDHNIETLISKVWSRGGEDKQGASAVIILLVKIDVSICY